MSYVERLCLVIGADKLVTFKVAQLLTVPYSSILFCLYNE